MTITEIRISLRDEGKLRGYVTITLDNIFVIRGLKIIRGWQRYFVAMPSCRLKNGSFSDVAHPITHEFRSSMEEKILEKYWEKVRRIREPEAFGV